MFIKKQKKMSRVRIDNPSASETQIRNLFESISPITNFESFPNYVIVSFKHPTAAKDVVEYFNGESLNNKPLIIRKLYSPDTNCLYSPRLSSWETACETDAWVSGLANRVANPNPTYINDGNESYFIFDYKPDLKVGVPLQSGRIRDFIQYNTKSKRLRRGTVFKPDDLKEAQAYEAKRESPIYREPKALLKAVGDDQLVAKLNEIDEQIKRLKLQKEEVLNNAYFGI